MFKSYSYRSDKVRSNRPKRPVQSKPTQNRAGPWRPITQVHETSPSPVITIPSIHIHYTLTNKGMLYHLLILPVLLLYLLHIPRTLTWCYRSFGREKDPTPWWFCLAGHFGLPMSFSHLPYNTRFKAGLEHIPRAKTQFLILYHWHRLWETNTMDTHNKHIVQSEGVWSPSPGGPISSYLWATHTYNKRTNDKLTRGLELL